MYANNKIIQNNTNIQNYKNDGISNLIDILVMGIIRLEIKKSVKQKTITIDKQKTTTDKQETIATLNHQDSNYQEQTSPNGSMLEMSLTTGL